MDTINQILKNILGSNSQVTKDYDEGAFVSVNKSGAFIRYNTGDCIWLSVIDGEYCVYRIDTHDSDLL